MRAVIRKRGERGSVVVETALVFIPTMFLMLGLIETSRGMWMYHTLSAAVKSAARYAIVHGASCTAAAAECGITVGNVASVVQQQGVGLDPSALKLSLVAGSSTVSCDSIAACVANSTAWPPEPNNAQGQPVELRAQYRFATVFWPFGNQAFVFNARAQESIQF